jgi:histidinol dehydrogenase|tara:strand:+ start:245 stop:496 length:252 start_codon:yes stop_codon:yes gene_type:complete
MARKKIQMTDLDPKLLDDKTDDPLVQNIIKRLATRSNLGIKKYGSTFDQAKKTPVELFEDIIEELLDAAVYLEKLKQTLKDAP